jgi:hypothetical protein
LAVFASLALPDAKLHRDSPINNSKTEIDLNLLTLITMIKLLFFTSFTFQKCFKSINETASYPSGNIGVSPHLATLKFRRGSENRYFSKHNA